MANLSPEVKEIKVVICNIRSASDYHDSIDDVKKKLKLPDSVTDYEIEALLIHTVREKFGESLDADMVLMALGLLKEFDNPRNHLEDRSGKELITERRKMFIEESSYVADRHNHNNKRRKRHYESWEELKVAGKDAIDAVVSALGSEEATNIKEVAKKIHGKRRMINEYLDEAKKYLIYDEEDNIVDVKLQELKNIRQEPVNDTPKDKLKKSNEQGLKLDSIQDDFSSVVEQKKESGSCSSPTENVPIETEQKHIKQPKNKIKGKHKIGLFALCVITSIVAIVVLISQKNANTYSPKEYTPQNRIVNVDEPDIDNVEEIFDEIIELIIRDPPYGDMVARGLKELGGRVTDNNPWINDFVEKTDTALELPSYKHPRGLEYWLTYREGEGNTKFITKEYFDYSTLICTMLKECFTVVGIREWECSESWKIPRQFESSDDFAKKSTDTIIQSALVLQEFEKFSEEPQFIIGFSLDEGRFLIYDPEVIYQ